MKLSRKFDKVLFILSATLCVVVFAILLNFCQHQTFADSTEDDEGSIIETNETGRHFVSIYDDGQQLTFRTDAATVAEVLERADVMISPGDKVEPSLDSAINMDNFFINIYRAHPVLLIDGATQIYTMTASYDPKTIMNEAGIKVYDGDEITHLMNSHFLEAGAVNTYQITRNGGRTITVEEEIAYDEETVRDYNLASGSTEIRQLGEVGRKEIVYNVQYVNNVAVSQELVSETVIKEPVTRIVAIGAKKSVAPEQETCAGWIRAAGISESDVSAALDLIYHESGCRVDAENAYSGAYGIPQALPGSKMSAFGSDWETNPVTQIKWMNQYVTNRYGGWQQASSYWWEHGWY